MLALLLVCFIGFALIFAEFYFPGGILATIGAGALLLALFLWIREFGTSWFFIFWMLFVGLGIYSTIKLALWRLSKGGAGTIILQDSQEGFQASEIDRHLLGKHAFVDSDLRPAGFIVFEEGRNEGKRFPAISESGFLQKGMRVKIVAIDGNDFLVRADHQL